MSANVFVELKANISQFQAKMGEAKSEITKLQKHQESAASQIATVGKFALAGVAGLAVGVGGMSIKAAMDEQASQKQLQAALAASHESWGKVSASVHASADEATKYGFTSTQVNQALTQGVISTQNYSKAHDNLNVAIELAAARHIDLSTAMQTVDKASAGQSRVLKQLGIDINVPTGGAKALAQAQDALGKAQANVTAIVAKFPNAANPASKAHAQYEKAIDAVTAAQNKVNAVQHAGATILDALKERLAGQASAAANSFSGRIAAMRAEGENLFAQIGTHLIPVLTRLMEITMDVVKWFEKHKDIAIALGAIIGGALAVAIGVYIAQQAIALATTVATGIASLVTGAQMLAGWLMALGPIGLVIAAIAAVIAVIVLVATHWKTVVGWLRDGWDFIKQMFDDGINWIKSHWELLVAILTGPIGIVVLLIRNHWNTIRTDVMTLITDIENFFIGLWNNVSRTVSGLIDGIANLFTSLPGRIGNAIMSGLGALGNVGKSIINGVIDGLNTAINAINSNIPSILGHKIFPSIGNIPHLATGGFLNAGQMALVGERGPELFMPSSSGTVVPNGALGGGTPTQVNLQINGTTFASLLLPALQTQVLQSQRSISVPVFGTVQ